MLWPKQLSSPTWVLLTTGAGAGGGRVPGYLTDGHGALQCLRCAIQHHPEEFRKAQGRNEGNDLLRASSHTVMGPAETFWILQGTPHFPYPLHVEAASSPCFLGTINTVIPLPKKINKQKGRRKHTKILTITLAGKTLAVKYEFFFHFKIFSMCTNFVRKIRRKIRN